MPKAEGDSIPERLQEAAALQDPQERIVRTFLVQNGLLSNLSRQSPELVRKLTDFFLGKKRVLVIGGESGMGKSLMGADVRTVHQDLQAVLRPEEHRPMTVITWDRSHDTFFDMSKIELGVLIQPPQGETHIEARDKISRAMAYTANFALDSYPDGLVVLEAPLFGNRGDRLIEQQGPVRAESQVLIMHSPASRARSLTRGRDLSTSAQKEAMIAMREVVKQLADINSKGLSTEAVDEEVKKWWVKKLKGVDGMVVEWDPDQDPKRFEDTRQRFKNEGISPDLIRPKPVSRYLADQYQHIFGTIPDVDDFLKKVTAD